MNAWLQKTFHRSISLLRAPQPLGAQQRQVLWSIMMEGGKFSMLDIFLGISGAVVVMRILSSELVSTTDPATFAAGVLVAGFALFDCCIPARSAMHCMSIRSLFCGTSKRT